MTVFMNLLDTAVGTMPGHSVECLVRGGADVRVVVTDPPAPHTTIVVGHDWAGPDVARAAVTASLTEIGLTPDEADAFLAAWDEAFFGPPPTEEDVVEIPASERIAEETPASEESILYFLPAADVERVATLTFEPAPTEVRRALAVWSALR